VHFKANPGGESSAKRAKSNADRNVGKKLKKMEEEVERGAKKEKLSETLQFYFRESLGQLV